MDRRRRLHRLPFLHARRWHDAQRGHEDYSNNIVWRQRKGCVVKILGRERDGVCPGISCGRRTLTRLIRIRLFVIIIIIINNIILQWLQYLYVATIWNLSRYIVPGEPFNARNSIFQKLLTILKILFFTWLTCVKQQNCSKQTIFFYRLRCGMSV